MTISEAQHHKIAVYVRAYLFRTAERHGHTNAQVRAKTRWMHSLNTLQNVRLILNGEQVEQDIRDVCEVAAIFHDVDHYTVQHEYHAIRGAETASRFLTKEGFDKTFIDRVAYAIREHNRDLDDEQPIEAQVQAIADGVTFEARMVMDADTLDKIGASNILQSVYSIGSVNKLITAEIARELTSGWPLQRAKLWQAMLTTPTGKQLGNQRFAFYEQFLVQLEQEMVMNDPYLEATIPTQEIAQV